MKNKRTIQKLGTFLSGIALMGAASIAQAAPPISWQTLNANSPPASSGNLNLLPGQLVGTCFSNLNINSINTDPDNYVLAVFDTQDPTSEGAVPGSLWRTDSGNPSSGPFYHYHGDQMRAAMLGEIFGVCLSRKNSPDIWVSGSSTYTGDLDPSDWQQATFPNSTLPTAPEQNGRIYRIDGTTGAPVDVVALNTLTIGTGSDSRPAELGNICWNESGNGTEWVYVSNLNDGLIYRLEAQNLQGSQMMFDHGISAGLPGDNTATEFTADERLVWAVQVHPSNGRLFYSVWNGRSTASEIWSVGLDATSGAFLPATAQHELFVPYSSSYVSPVASISFSTDGTVLYAAERWHHALQSNGVYPGDQAWRSWTPSAHSQRVLDWTYNTTSSSWDIAPQITASSFKYYLGTYRDGTNSAGGVVPDCDGNVWATGNFTTETVVSGKPYGAQRIPSGGNFATTAEQRGSTSLWIDYDNSTAAYDKLAIGALAYWKPCACMEIATESIDCPEELGDEYQITLSVTNLIEQTASRGLFRACPEEDLPEGAVTTTPTSPISLFNLNQPISQGETTTIPFTIDGFFGGQKVCFLLTTFNDRMEECCTEKFCIDVPRCDCAVILDQVIVGEELANGDVKHTITLTVRNSTHLSSDPYPFHYSFVPPESGIDNSLTVLNPNPILPGQVGTVTYCFVCPQEQQPCPEKIQTIVSFHDGSIVNCCSIDVCFELEPLGKIVQSDECTMRTPDAFLCLRNGEWEATLTATICNNFCEARSYDILGDTDGPGMSVTILDSLPVGPIPPGECRDVAFKVSGIIGVDESARYRLQFSPTDGGLSLTCGGTVTRSSRLVAKFPSDINVLIDNSTAFPIDFENFTDADIALPIEVSSGFDIFTLSIEGQPTTGTTLVVPANGSTSLTMTAQVTDPSRTDLPPFVDIYLLWDDGVSLNYLSTSVQVIPDSVPKSLVQCLSCKKVATEGSSSNSMVEINLKVMAPDISVKINRSADLSNWVETPVRTSPSSSAESQITLSEGIHKLYIDDADSPNCFFRAISN